MTRQVDINAEIMSQHINRYFLAIIISGPDHYFPGGGYNFPLQTFFLYAPLQTFFFEQHLPANNFFPIFLNHALVTFWHHWTHLFRFLRRTERWLTAAIPNLCLTCKLLLIACFFILKTLTILIPTNKIKRIRQPIRKESSICFCFSAKVESWSSLTMFPYIWSLIQWNVK